MRGELLPPAHQSAASALGEKHALGGLGEQSTHMLPVTASCTTLPNAESAAGYRRAIPENACEPFLEGTQLAG